VRKRDCKNTILTSFALGNYGTRHVIAFPAVKERHLFTAALKRYQPDTPKRALFRYWLKFAAQLHLPGIWSTVSSTQLEEVVGFRFIDWLVAVSKVFANGSPLPVFIWPPEPSRKRIYIHLLNRKGDALGFAKIAFDSENNNKLQIECETLITLARVDYKTFHVPSVIDNGEFDNNSFLIVEPVPDTVKTYRASNIGFPSEAVKEYAGPIQAVSYDQVEKKDWWNRFVQKIDEGSGFIKNLRTIATDEKIRLCRIHGDMGPSNLLQNDGQLWIIDWEESVEKGPYLTDYVSFYLALNRKQVMKKAHTVLPKMISEFSSGPHYAKPIDIMMALAFLRGAKFTLASKLIDIWPEKEKPWL